MISYDSRGPTQNRPQHRGDSIRTSRQSTYVYDVERWVNEGGALRPHSVNGYSLNTESDDRRGLSSLDRRAPKRRLRPSLVMDDDVVISEEDSRAQ